MRRKSRPFRQRVLACISERLQSSDAPTKIVRSADSAQVDDEAQGDLPHAAYIHLPFCRQRCAYCSFPIVVQSSRMSSNQQRDAEDAYISLLLAEIAATRNAFGRRQRGLRSVYFGGGTPSLISPRGMERIMDALNDAFGILSGCEITCEMDPATFDTEKAKSFAQIGINRASVGVQSFNNVMLEKCGRGHSVKDIYAALESLRQANFNNVSLDLISGLPDQTLDTWSDSLSSAVSVLPQHISIYDLEIDDGTKFGRLYTPGQHPLPAEEVAADMLRAATERLQEAGYTRYEVSNFAAAEKWQSRHNMTYWGSELFYGFGLGSTSLVRLPDGGIVRFRRPTRMTHYKQYVQSLKDLSQQRSASAVENASPLAALYPHARTCTTEELLEDTVINSFRRLAHGLDLNKIRRDFGDAMADALLQACDRSDFVRNGLLVKDNDDLGRPIRLKLTSEGALFENSIVSTLLYEALWKRKDE